MENAARQDVPPGLHRAIQERLREGRLPCAEVFALAKEWGQKPREVAAVAEQMGIRIGWCQLGLFEGEKKHEKRPAPPPAEVSPALRTAITAALEEGHLPCARAWAIARKLGLGRLQVGRAADALGVHIVRCQLGCFP